MFPKVAVSVQFAPCRANLLKIDLRERCFPHQMLRVTPAMEGGVTDKCWDLTDIVRIVDEWEIERPEN
jgi:hypothetical protein